MSVGSRIKELRENKNISRNELADLLGVTVGSISNYENEVSSPKEPILFKIMEVLHCDANYLFQDAINMPTMENTVSVEEHDIIKKYRTLDTYGKDAVDSVLDIEYTRCQVKEEPFPYIPDNIRPIDYYMKNASAGSGQVVFDDTVVERITIPDIPKYKRVAYAIGVNGNSMEPLYHDGDMLLIEPTVDMEIGEVGIFIVDGEAYVKKLGNGELISLNKDYSNIPLTEYTSCMGRVVDNLSQK
ncbi:MAG: XRE family transcriptional regulator [Anaerovoracaceae bacterium]|nr:XRE family transcriptional regulator [Anaerovoracaceae bacterium]